MRYIDREEARDDNHPTRRSQLLDAAVEYAATNGIGDLSLRQLASALGTSHRMLVYHFGSKEGLLVAVVRAVEERQRAFLADLATDADLPPAELGWRVWDRLADPAMWPYEKLFFEVYSQALRGRPHTTAMLDGVIEAWLRPTRRARPRGSASPSPGVCCSTCWPPATGTACAPRWASSWRCTRRPPAPREDRSHECAVMHVGRVLQGA
jgi:AcrR family transcriptional regulator